MFTSVLPAIEKKSFCAKAQLNLLIARDLAESFGGKEADYLKRLNRRLKREIHFTTRRYSLERRCSMSRLGSEECHHRN